MHESPDSGWLMGALCAAADYQAVHAEEAKALGRESAGFLSLALQCLARYGAAAGSA